MAGISAILFAAVLSASSSGPFAVRVEKDVDYLGPDRAEKLDLYLPVDPPEGVLLPGVVIIHGGGWIGGDKRAAREQNIGNTLASNGYVCASINYALAAPGRPTWPGNIHDCKRAVLFLRRNAQKYGIDAQHIGAIGGSAGGHLTAMLALTGADSALDPPDAAPAECRIQAAVPMYGPVTISKDTNMLPGTRLTVPELYRRASPVAHITDDDPPLLILHGTADDTVPLEESLILDAALERGGVNHELVIVDAAPHSFHLEPKQYDLRPLVLAFFDEYLKGQKGYSSRGAGAVERPQSLAADFLALCDKACGELLSPDRKVPYYHDSYAVRGLTVAYDMTRRARYIEACQAWSDRMIELQDKMSPEGAYYMNYGRKPGSEQGGWYVADSSSIAMGLLATAVRSEQPDRKTRYLQSVERFARLVLQDYTRPSGGITDGIWSKYDGEWWCSTGIFASLALLLAEETGNDSYRQAGLAAIDWLNALDLATAEPYPLSEMGPCMMMYVLEAYSAAWPYLEPGSARQRGARAQMACALEWMDRNQASRAVSTPWDYSSQWGSKFGGLPFHMDVYARRAGGDARIRAQAGEELEYIGRRLAAETEPGLSQLSVFAMMSYAERLWPGALYRSTRDR